MCTTLSDSFTVDSRDPTQVTSLAKKMLLVTRSTLKKKLFEEKHSSLSR